MTKRAEMAQPTQLVLVDAGLIKSLQADIAEIRAMIRDATVIPAPEWVSIAEAARRLDCSTDTIRRRVAAGSMQAKGNGKLKRVRV